MNAALEIRALRRQKATREQFLARAEYFDRYADNLEGGYARDLADWEAGSNERSDLADPRDPEVAAHRANTVQDFRNTADAIRNAAPEA